MSEIRILTADDFEALVPIFADAYPGIEIKDRAQFRERLKSFHEQDPTADFYGLFREGQLLGIMCLYDFWMNFLDVRIPVGGVGQIAVHLAHKKEHVAKELMLYYLRHYRNEGVPLAALYPFRPDFYRNMGFGYGPKMNRYRIEPSSLRRGPPKAHIRYLANDDRQALVDCYQRVAERTHGLMDKTVREVKQLFERPEHRLVGYERDGQLGGYLVFAFEKGETFLLNDLRVHELIYETPEALAELMAFLHSQADQIRLILFDSQDPEIHYLFRDPRDDSGQLIPSVYHQTNTQGVGLMYRVLDVAGILRKLEGRNFGGQTLTLLLRVEDSFLPENGGSTLLRWEDGRLGGIGGLGEPDVEVRLRISDFSSLLAGTARFDSLYRYRLADVSDPAYVPVLDRLFAVAQPPRCTTSF